MEIRRVVDIEKAKQLLATSYWADSRPADLIEKSFANSRVYGAWEGEEMIGMTRVVTDGATFAWLCDVMIDETYRGKGVGKILVEATLNDPELEGVRWLLATMDAQSLYAKYGFEEVTARRFWMTRGFKRTLTEEGDEAPCGS